MCSLNDECALESTGGQKTHTDACACTSDFVAGCLHAVQEGDDKQTTSRPCFSTSDNGEIMSYVWKKKEKEKEKISAQRISVSHAVMTSGNLRGWLYRDMNLTPIPCSTYKQNHDAVSRRKQRPAGPQEVINGYCDLGSHGQSHGGAQSRARATTEVSWTMHSWRRAMEQGQNGERSPSDVGEQMKRPTV